MFAVDATFTHLAARREQVLVLLQSINGISVKVPGIPTSPAMGYIVGWDVGNGNASAAIYLYFTVHARAVAYLYDPGVFPLTQLPQVTDEAVEFLESMGFMLDDTAYGTKKPEEQVALIERTPLFHADLAKFAASQRGDEVAEAAVDEPEVVAPAAADSPALEAPSDRAQALGRLLMSF